MDDENIFRFRPAGKLLMTFFIDSLSKILTFCRHPGRAFWESEESSESSEPKLAHGTMKLFRFDDQEDNPSDEVLELPTIARDNWAKKLKNSKDSYPQISNSEKKDELISQKPKDSTDCLVENNSSTPFADATRSHLEFFSILFFINFHVFLLKWINADFDFKLLLALRNRLESIRSDF